MAEVVEGVRRVVPTPLSQTTRARHLATIRRHRPTEPERTPWASRLQRRLAPITAAAAGLALFAGGGAVAFAQDAGPDDALYGVKLASERVWVATARGPERAAGVHLALAERRIDEASAAPDRAEELVAAGVENILAASEERPEEAIRTFERLLLGAGEEALPDQASPRARWALARNCHRIAEQHDLEHSCPAPDEFDEHPGRGQGPPDGVHPGRGADRGEGQRGWGPGGRPEGTEGPPPGVPAHERGQPGGEADAAEEEDG